MSTAPANWVIADSQVVKMTIAAQIKSFHMENETVKNWDDFSAELDQKAVDTDQDWDLETTTYTFADGSCIVLSGSEVRAYGSK